MNTEEIDETIHILQHTLGKMELALGSIVESIFWTDNLGRIRWCNKVFAELLGVTHLDVLNRPVSSLLPLEKDGELLQGLDNPFAQCYQRGRMVEGVYVFRFGEKRKDLEIRGTHFRYQQGELTAVFVIRDITMRLHLEQDLRQAQKLEAIGSLAAGIAHEINTPIQYIGDNVRYIQEEIQGLLDFVRQAQQLCRPGQELSGGVRRLRELLEALDIEFLEAELPRASAQSLEGVNHITEIVRSVKAFSGRNRAGEQGLYDINKGIQDTVNLSRGEWKYHAHVVTELDEALKPVTAYSVELNQVLLNLLINAAHAIEEKNKQNGSSEQGEIRITTKQNDTHVMIEIRDSGVGISPEIAARIFDPFFTTKEVGKGTGQGLHIAWQIIVEKHRGQISVEPNPGSGACFKILLPRQVVTDAAMI